MENKVEKKDELEEFFEAINLLALKERDDADFELMKRAVGSLWQNIDSNQEEDASLQTH